MNKIEIKGVDYIVARHSDVMRIKSEYDAIFVESKGIKQVGKDYRKEKVFLITQGTDTHIPMLKQSCAYIEEVGFTNVTILASVFKFDKDKEREVKSMLGWNAPLINVGHLKSATRSLNALESLFD